jgi:hypothetical protein
MVPMTETVRKKNFSERRWKRQDSKDTYFKEKILKNWFFKSDVYHTMKDS